VVTSNEVKVLVNSMQGDAGPAGPPGVPGSVVSSPMVGMLMELGPWKGPYL
jgi:hypothetical protein